MVTQEHSTRETIVVAARDLFVEAGLARFSMRKVAGRAGISATAIYRHFDDKEALLMAVLEHGFEVFGGYLFNSLGAASALGRLTDAGVAYMHFGLENPGYYRMMFMSSCADLGFEDMPENNQEKLAPTFMFLVDRVRECIADGVFRDADPVELAAMIWSHVHGMTSLYLSDSLHPVIRDRAAFEAFYRGSLDRLYQGLLAA